VLDLLLPYGSEQLDRVAFEQALDAIGARESAGSEFSLQVLSQDFERGVERWRKTNCTPRCRRRRWT
jgi:zinc protease